MRWWVFGELSSGSKAVEVIRSLRAAGFPELDAYSPYPVEGMAEALELPRSWTRYAAFFIGIGAAAFGYWVQWYVNAVAYPLNVGDRPLNSWPAFIPDAYETLILFASFGAFLALMLACRLPRLHHPAFRAPGFERTTVGKFWVSVATKRENERDDAVAKLIRLGAENVSVVSEEEE